MKKVVMAAVIGAALVMVGHAQQAPAPAPMLLKVGDTAPAFSLMGSDGKTHTLADYKGKYVVVAWYPKAFTGGCTAECKAFTSSGDTIKKFDVAYFMASVDDADTNKKFAEQEQANFPMLSDPDKKVAMAYGVVPPTGAGFAKRWTFYIGPDSKIVYIDDHINTATAGADLAARLEAIGAHKK
jgi:peroxiredoxin Q/BCP